MIYVLLSFYRHSIRMSTHKKIRAVLYWLIKSMSKLANGVEHKQMKMMMKEGHGIRKILFQMKNQTTCSEQDRYAQPKWKANGSEMKNAYATTIYKQKNEKNTNNNEIKCMFSCMNWKQFVNQSFISIPLFLVQQSIILYAICSYANQFSMFDFWFYWLSMFE